MEELKRIIKLTKETDSHYLHKKNSKTYNPLCSSDFQSWKVTFNNDEKIYESFHNDLLYTNEKQNFDDTIDVFRN